MKNSKKILIVVLTVVMLLNPCLGFLNHSDVEAATNYTKRTIDLTYLTMGDEIGHNHVYETKYDSNQHWKQCIICDKQTEITGHTYSTNWTMGDSCAQSNKLNHACACGYSYQTPNTRAHTNVTPCIWESNTYHTVNQCQTCRDKADAKIEIHYDAGGQLGCKTGRSGTCSACGGYVDGTMHEAWLNPDVTNVNNNHDEYHGQTAACTKCGKTLVSDYVADISYNGTRMYYTLKVTYNWDIASAPTKSFTPGFYPGGSGTVYNSSYSINGKTVTYYEEAEMPANYETRTVLFYNPTIRTADGTYFTIHQDSLVIPEKTIPQGTNVIQVDVTSQNDWSTAKRITISGTENYCSYVTVTVRDESGRVYADNVKALVNNNNYTYSFIPKLEADANGRKLIAEVRDSLGNVTSKEFMVYKIDNYEPTIVGSLETGKEWSKSKDVTYYAKDGGIRNVQLSFATPDDFQLGDYANDTYEREYTFVGDVYGTAVTRLYAKDALGNNSDAYVKISNLDNTAPTVTDLSKDLVLLTDDSKVDITVTANDINTTLNASGSGVVAYMITTDTTMPSETDSRWQESNVVSVSENGTYYVWAKDLVGNVSNYKEIKVTELMAKYTVNHHQMNLDGATYTLVETESETVKTNSKVTPAVKTYEGFTSPSTITKNVAADGSTVIDYYYTRNKYKITLNGDVGVDSLVGAGTYFYDQEVLINANVNDAYVWNYWDGESSTLIQNYTVIIPAYDITYNAHTLKKVDVVTKYKNYYKANEIADEYVQHLIETNSYSTAPIDIPGYKYFESYGETNGVLGVTDVEVTYYYKQISAGVDVRFVDDVTGEELSVGIHYNGVENDGYTTEAKDITGYILESTPANQNGVMKVELTTVTYTYRKASRVITSFVDLNTNQYIADSENDVVKEGYNYQTEPKTIDGYVLISTPENAQGTMGRTNIYVDYGYKKISGGVDIKYIDDKTGEELVTTIHIDGNENDEYISNAKTIPGYELEVKPSNPKGILTVDPITVEYRYRKVSSVNAKYIDLNSKQEITPTVSKKYKEGYDYTTEEKTFAGYVLIDNPENKNGTMGREDIPVTYGYKKIAGGVEIKYIDDVTNQNLETPTILTGNENDEYTSTEKTFDGYAIEKTATNPTGLMTVAKINVTYTYRKLSTVTTKYVDMISGEEIVPATSKQVKQGYEFKTEPQAIPGYVLIENSNNTQGTMQRENVEVTYYYKKISEGITVNYVDMITNDLLDSKSYTGNEGDIVTLEKLAISGYTFDSTDAPEEMEAALTVAPQTYTFYYRKAVSVTVIHKDTTNNKVLDTETLNGEEGKYFNAMSKEYDGYVLMNATTAITGTFSRDTNTVVFEYKQKSPGVTIKYVDEEGTVMDQDVIYGFVGDKYVTVDKEYEKYDFVEVEGQTSGVLTTEPIEVIYKYEKKKSHIYVTYVDEFGETLLEEEFEDKVDSEYKIEPTEIENYRVKELPENIEGIYELEDTYVTIKMERIPGKITVLLKDEEGNVIGEFVVDGFVGDEPEVFDIPDIDGYTKDSDDQLTFEFIDGEIVAIVTYAKIPETGDINVIALAIVMLVSATIIVSKAKKVVKNN